MTSDIVFVFVFPERQRKGGLTSELNVLFTKFLQSVEHVIDDRLLTKLQNTFPEWSWFGEGIGFISEVTLEDAVHRVEILLSDQIQYEETENKHSSLSGTIVDLFTLKSCVSNVILTQF
jgi:hypothetical protein